MAKRRKGKNSSGTSTPTNLTPPPSASPSDNEEESNNPKKDDQQQHMTTLQQQLCYPKEICPLILTSEKRRGIYECDYCHSDISQLPRIRCAVCPDFDLCLDCFATTDHTSAIDRLKAAANTHSELSKDGIASTMVAGLSSAAANHDHSHGYRVCDSTRFPIFGSARNIVGEVTNTTTEENIEMDVDGTSSEKKSADPSEAESTADKNIRTATNGSDFLIISEDPKGIWTAEEDLRLLDAIKTHGLGNWADISEAIGGNGSVGKTPKRCMERYFDDFLGRYGHILPACTIVDDDVEEETLPNTNYSNDGDSSANKPEEEDAVRVSKRRQALMARTSSNLNSSTAISGKARKRFKVMQTESLSDYDKLWPEPYLPSVDGGVKVGQEVARDLSKKAELAFVKATAEVSSKEQADKIRQEWIETRMNQLGAPTVLPPRPEDTALLPGANLMGFMPRREDFDVEWENDAEQAIADMEFTQADLPQDRQLKLQVLDIYYQKQEEREKRKKFIMSRNLYDYRKFLQNEEKIPTDERDMIHRLRLFERFHTPEEHKQFIADILKAKRLRKEISTLQMYRRIGVRSLLEAEKYELDKERRQFHKVAQLQKETEKGKSALSVNAVSGNVSNDSVSTGQSTEPGSGSLWKQYRNSDRKVRRSINRTSSGVSQDITTEALLLEKQGESDKKEECKEKQEGDVEMKDASADTDPSTDGKNEQSEIGHTESRGNVSARKKNVGVEDTKQDEIDIFESKGLELLSRKEIALCTRLKIFPLQYLEIKKALIHESLKDGLLDKEGPGSTRRIIVKVDVEKRGNILDFFVRAGWISKSLAGVARTVTPTD